MQLSISSVSLKSLKLFATGICALSVFFSGCLQVTWASPDQAGQVSENPSADLRNLSLEQLGNVQVTSVSKEPQEVWNTAAAIYVLTQDDIRRSGATSIPEVLRLVPGVEVARIDSDHWSVGIRGFGSEFSRSVLVLIDGRSVYTPLFSGVYWNVQNVMLEDVDRIEVIRGPGGTIWGANAVNGVINIITKSAKDTHGALVSVLGGNVDQGEGHFRMGGGNGHGFDYRVYGMAFGRAAEFHPDHVNFDEWQMGQGGFRTDWQSADNRDTFTVEGDMYKGYDGERVQVALYAPPSTLTFNDPHNVSGGNLNAVWRHTISDTSDFRVQSYYDRTSRLSPQLNEIRNTLDVDFLYHLNWRNRQDILLGAGGRWSPDTIQQKFATINFIPQQETDSIYSWFAQDQISIVPKKLLLTLGSKFEYNNYSGFEVQPNGRLLWAPDDHNSVWVAVTRAVRTPDRLDQDLQLTDFLLPGAVPTYLRVLGNPNFTSEEMLGTEVGYRTLLARKLYLDTTYFHNSYNHLDGYGASSILLEPTPAPLHAVFELPFANANAGDTQGIEIAPDWKPLPWVELKGSYSYLHLFVHPITGVAGSLDPLVTTADNGSSPHHQIEMQSLFDLPKKFEFDATFRFVSALPAQTSTPAGATVQAYNTGDARLAWHAIPGLELSLVGQNLFQPDHPEFGGDDGPLVGIRRSYYGKVTWTTP